jgi:TonB-dependent SusC/RagA subfamily outer membrane receptor
MRSLLLFVLLLCSQCSLRAQARFASLRPALPVKTARVQVQVEADAFTATTQIQLEFFNPNDSAMEARYWFQLEPGQAVTGLQLDINGHFREGSIEQRAKAARAYTEVTGMRIDPALLSGSGNNYNLRIYPVPGKGTRRAIITVQELLRTSAEGIQYRLLFPHDSVAEYEASVLVRNVAARPVPGGFLKDAEVEHQEAYGFHRLQRGRIRLDGLSFVLPLGSSPQFCSWQAGGKEQFVLHYAGEAPQWRSIAPQRLTVYCDVLYRSALSAAERQFLRQYIWTHHIRELTFYTWNGEQMDTARFDLDKSGAGDWARHLDTLKRRNWSYQSLDFSADSGDLVFLFTSTLQSAVLAGKKPVFHVAGGRWMSTLYRADHGLKEPVPLIDLARLNTSQAVVAASRVAWSPIGLRLTDGRRLQLLSQEGSNFTVYGELEPGATVQAVYGDHLSEKVTGAWSPHTDGSCTGLPADKLSALAEFDAAKSYDWAQQMRWGARNGIVMQPTAYIVLERVEDYIKYDIKPPKELEEECAGRNYVWKDKAHLFEEWSELEVLREAADEYNRRLRICDPGSAPMVLRTRSELQLAVVEAKAAQEALAASASGGSLNEVVVTSLGLRRKLSEIGYSTTTVRSSQWSAGSGNVGHALSGRVSGLQVNGAGSNIVLRGLRSITGDQQPLFVVDGVLVQAAELNRINPNDVSYIDVLKSGAGSAVYGANGANGVIIIRTRMAGSTGYMKGPYRFKDMPEETYVLEVRGIPLEKKMDKYNELRAWSYLGEKIVFHFEVAQELFNSGLKKEAFEALMNARSMSFAARNTELLRGIAYLLEEWGFVDSALAIHRRLYKNSPNIQTSRDIAFALNHLGHYQDAVDTLYSAITNSWMLRAEEALHWKGSLLQDLNAIVSAHRAMLDLSRIHVDLLRPVPVAQRVIVESNMAWNATVEVLGPDAGRRKGAATDSTAGFVADSSLWNGFGEYLQARRQAGAYRLRLRDMVRFWGYSERAPLVVRIIRYEADGAPRVNSLLLDNQGGTVEIDDWQIR